MNVVFFGTPDFAVPFLEALVGDEDFVVQAVVTQPDKPVGRKQVMTPSPVKVFAEENSIRVVHDPTELLDVESDAFVVIAYGNILPKEIIDHPRLGTINVHPSLLPKFRGPSPVQSAIASGDKETGVSIMLLDEKMDHGPILGQETISIDPLETSESLRKKIVQVGTPLLIKVIKDFSVNKISAQEQNDDEATVCKLLTRKDGVIDWTQPAAMIDSKIRAYQPWPGTSTTWVRNDKPMTIKILKAVTATDRDSLEPGRVSIADGRLFVGTDSSPIEVLELQLAGKPAMDAKTFINGYKDIHSTSLTPR